MPGQRGTSFSSFLECLSPPDSATLSSLTSPTPSHRSFTAFVPLVVAGPEQGQGKNMRRANEMASPSAHLWLMAVPPPSPACLTPLCTLDQAATVHSRQRANCSDNCREPQGAKHGWGSAAHGKEVCMFSPCTEKHFISGKWSLFSKE